MYYASLYFNWYTQYTHIYIWYHATVCIVAIYLILSGLYSSTCDLYIYIRMNMYVMFLLWKRRLYKLLIIVTKYTHETVVVSVYSCDSYTTLHRTSRDSFDVTLQSRQWQMHNATCCSGRAWLDPDSPNRDDNKTIILNSPASTANPLITRNFEVIVN